jgi:hypothetical protein
MYSRIYKVTNKNALIFYSRKQKRELKQKKKQEKRQNLKMGPLKGDQVDLQADNEIFSLTKIKTKKQLLDLQKTLPELTVFSDEEIDSKGMLKTSSKKIKYKKDDLSYLEEEEDNHNQKSDSENEDFHSHEDADSGMSPGDDNNSNEDEANPLLDDLISSNLKEAKKSHANNWFNRVKKLK